LCGASSAADLKEMVRKGVNSFQKAGRISKASTTTKSRPEKESFSLDKIKEKN
jgi:hypothetical protein